MRVVTWAQALLIPLLFVVLWSVATELAWVNTKLIPAPTQVLATAAKTFTQAEFWHSAAASFGRALGGFVLGTLLAILFGVWVGVYRWADLLFAPTFNALRQVSLFAWLPLISTFLGYDNSAKVFFIMLLVFYPVALHTIDGVRQIPLAQYEVAQVYQFSRVQLLKKLILPAAAPQILVGVQLGLIFAWLATIGSEFLLANYGVGLGNILIQGRAALDVAVIVVGMLVIGGIGLLLNALAQRGANWILRWRPQVQTGVSP